MTTGWPPGLLQDDCRKLSKWFASRPEARYLVRRNLMTDCTLADQARYLADNVREMPASCAIALRSLANQLEALTAERDVLSAVVASYERVGIVAHDGMNAKVGWTKPVRHNTMLFAVKDPK